MNENVALDETIAEELGATIGAEGLDETLVPTSELDADTTRPEVSRGADARFRTTVLPRLKTSGTSSPKLQQANAPRYELLKPLGEGGLGEVLLVRDNDIRRQVAMKKLKAGQRAAEVHRFVEEIQLVGALDHPNIVPVHDVGIDEDGKFYFIMKFVEGETLEELIERLRAGDPKTLAEYSVQTRAYLFLEMLRAIRCAHQAGIIHRDIKPANVMVGTIGEVMVMDWGLAKRIDGEASAQLDDAIPLGGEHMIHKTGRFETQVGVIMGTPAYMAPEQARGDNDKLDERTDIYALSVLFHELLTLRHYLRDKNTLNQVLMEISNNEPGFNVYKEADTQVPAEFLWFAHKGMQKNPEDRFQSIIEMELQLKAILSGEINVQCAATFMRKKSADWMGLINRRPAVAATMFMSVLGLTLFGLSSIVWTLVT